MLTRSSVIDFMHHILPPVTPINQSRGGGRVASDAYRNSLALCDEFCGLEEGTDRYSLLLLVKKAGRAAGFTPRMIQLLDYYMAFTRDVDWQERGRPIIYQSLSRTALDLGVSERQIQKLEQALFERRAITWNDSGNHRRHGQRDLDTGRILYAFGVDLTPLAYLRQELQELLHEKELYDQAWLETKRQISWYRRQICALLAEWSREEGAAANFRSFESQYAEIAIQIRTHLDLETLRSLLARHKSFHSALMAAMGVGEPAKPDTTQQRNSLPKTRNGSSKSERTIAYYNYSNHEINKSNCSPSDASFQKSVAAKPVPLDPRTSSGLHHVTLRMAVQSAGERIQQWLPSEPNWPDLIEAAYRERQRLGISQSSWAEACEILGRTGAALCLVVTDRAAERPDDPVRKPAAYFRGMVKRARAGQLRLHNSVFGLLNSQLPAEQV